MRPAVNLFSPKHDSLTIHPLTTQNSSDGFAQICQRPGLLVSVRNWQEASIALDAGVDVLDLKEPLNGPLGAVEPNEIQVIIAGMQCNIERFGKIPLSVALGELRDWVQPERVVNQAEEFTTRSASGDGQSHLPTLRVHENPLPLPSFVRFAKLGLAGMGSRANWQSLWRRAMSRLGNDISPVAVAYADHALANSPAPDQVLSFAIEFGCKAFLIDTWDKTAGSLTGHLSVPQISRLVQKAKAAEMTVALAGSLSISEIPAIAQCQPDLIAIRSAACSGGRSGAICSKKIGEFKRLILESFHESNRQFGTAIL